VVLKHEAIQSFPSKQFYESQLHIGHSQQAQPSTLLFWPHGADKPIMFVNIVGVEKTLTVATADGSEQSKSNDKEASLAVRCFSYTNELKSIHRVFVVESETVNGKVVFSL